MTYIEKQLIYWMKRSGFMEGLIHGLAMVPEAKDTTVAKNCRTCMQKYIDENPQPIQDI